MDKLLHITIGLYIAGVEMGILLSQYVDEKNEPLAFTVACVCWFGWFVIGLFCVKKDNE